MDIFDIVNSSRSIDIFLNGLVFWIQALPTWGMVVVMLILSGISSKLGVLANIACGILVWNVFGMPWGLLFLGASAICWLVVIGIAWIENR